MVYIKDIGLQLDYEENLHAPRMYSANFGFRNRFIGNYLRRQVKSIKFEYLGYTRLVINACRKDIGPNKMYENCLSVSVPFDQTQYNTLSNESLTDFLIALYQTGIVKAKETHEIPVEFLLDKLNQFKRDNYKNEWEFKSKTFKEIGIKATLACQITMDKFTLNLILTKKSEIVFKTEILTTSPDETCYHYQFKDLVFEDNKIKVTGWYDNPPLYELDLSFNV